MQITEVAQNTHLLYSLETAEYKNREISYLLTGDALALIEPGSTITSSKLLTTLSENGFDLDNIAYVIPTHIHIDHGGGTGYLAQNLPGAKVVLHPRASKHMIGPSKLIKGTRAVFGEHFEEKFGSILPVPENQVHVATDGEMISLGKRDLRIFFSPGHAPHHLSIHDSQTGGLFCGEAFGIPLMKMPHVPLPAAAPPSFDLELYLETMDKLQSLSPRVLFYSHYGVGSDVNNLIELVKDLSRSFGDIIKKALEAEEGKDEIWKRLSEYLTERFPGADPENISEISIAGYTGYFKGKKQSSS